MNLPEKLVINGMPYKVLQVEGFIEEDHKSGVQLGDINPWKQQIQVSKEAEGEYAAKVLLHEAIHGILSEYGLDRINNERTVSVLTAGFYDFIKANDLNFIRKDTGAKPSKNQIKAKRIALLEGNELVLPSVTSYKDPQKKVLDLYQQTEEKPVSATEATKRFRAAQQEESRSRQLPLLGSGSTGFSIAERLQGSFLQTEQETAVQETEEMCEKQEPEHWKTGVKKENGEKYYKTYYICPNCGDRSRRYVLSENEYVKCHECDTKIKKIDATAKGFPDRDAFGNFFNAFDFYEEADA
ncbi:hypothetical protein QRX25_10575 [Bacillus sp. L381]|uniref:hypothetical protein n=1 Tax=Bacillus TaxID=1386 RepID=UPI001BA7A49C|nr:MULTISPECIES: hypothetical protein [Bacillus]MCR9040918.1 hypothetical protein [Bacillus velezensis]QUN07997.1 hypothetical protein KEF49_10425 [Bacillus amyloliquefaciens]QYM81063.1 hypothetical protein KTJ85_10275 [Bacillus sp. 7D3]QZY10211.1 hypothetical protein K7B13_10505 [Bacillus amyloliquefaciens]QZY11121.1 hypothetical protein K7B13_15505 [Bacillus amyloliquefaciens]